MAVRKDICRVFIPDSHGNHIDLAVRDAFLKDLKRLNPDQIIMLGDHVHCGGIFSTHARSYTNEMTESYDEDVGATNEFLDLIQKAAPRAEITYIEGNHEARVQRWAASTFQSQKDAKNFLSAYGIPAVLDLKRRGIKYIERGEFYNGVSIPGTIRMTVNGIDTFATHGISAAEHAAAVHLARFGATVIFGHTHRPEIKYGRTVTKSALLAATPGTLAMIQPLYLHTNPSKWGQGYGLQLVSPSGLFMYQQMPLFKGVSLLDQFGKVIGTKRRAA